MEGDVIVERTVLILGASEEFLELVRKAKAWGLRVLVCDGRAGAPAKSEADEAFDIAVTDIDRIARLCKEHNVDHIITGFSDLLLECMVRIADRAGLPCYIKPEQLPYYRSKSAMKEMFEALGIPTSRYVVFGGDDELDSLNALRFPVVIKPIDMYGSRGIVVCDDVDDIRLNFDYACETSRDKRVIVEEYNDGYEFNTMAWVHEGTVRILGIADREKTPTSPKSIPYSSRNVYPSCLTNAVKAEVHDILQRVVGYTGQRTGELSMQFFWKPGGHVEVCEVAARFLGYEHELIAYAGGVSIEELLLCDAYRPDRVEALLTDEGLEMDKTAAVLYFQGRQGRIASLDQFRSIGSNPHVNELWLFYHEGEHVAPFAQPYFARCTITCDTRAEVDEVTRAIYGQAFVPDDEGKQLLLENRIPSYPRQGSL